MKTQKKRNTSLSTLFRNFKFLDASRAQKHEVTHCSFAVTARRFKSRHDVNERYYTISNESKRDNHCVIAKQTRL